MRYEISRSRYLFRPHFAADWQKCNEYRLRYIPFIHILVISRICHLVIISRLFHFTSLISFRRPSRSPGTPRIADRCRSCKRRNCVCRKGEGFGLGPRSWRFSAIARIFNSIYAFKKSRKCAKIPPLLSKSLRSHFRHRLLRNLQIGEMAPPLDFLGVAGGDGEGEGGGDGIHDSPKCPRPHLIADGDVRYYG